jgi:choline dehydrogenase-like flavoprotein
LAAILTEAGAERTFTVTSPNTEGDEFVTSGQKMSAIPASRHIAGTARMGHDPATSVCDAWGRLHQMPNVLIADSSLFPTGAGYGPTLTLVALAIRNARALTT